MLGYGHDLYVCVAAFASEDVDFVGEECAVVNRVEGAEGGFVAAIKKRV